MPPMALNIKLYRDIIKEREIEAIQFVLDLSFVEIIIV